MIFCPTVSERSVAFSKFPLPHRCPNGINLMKDAEIPMSFVGGGPYIVRQNGKLIGGCLAYIIDTLSIQFGFKPILTPEKGFSKLIASVSLVNFSIVLKHYNLRSLPRFPEGMFK